MSQKLLTTTMLFAVIVLVIAPTRLFAAICQPVFTMSGIAQNGAITRTLTVKNQGTGTCKNVSFSLYYPSEENFVSSSIKPTASNYYWYIGTLASRKSFTTSLVTKTTAPTSVVEGCVASPLSKDVCAVSTVTVTSNTTPIISSPGTSPNPIIIATTTPVSPSTSTQIITPPMPNSSFKEQGIWIWNFPSQMNNLTGYSQLEILKSYGFNVLYITIDDYLEIAVLPEGTSKENAKRAYFSSLSTFVTKAKSFGFQVDVEGGANNWAESAHRWKGFALIDAMKEYNTKYPTAAVRALQYDVEPHTLSTYETNKSVSLKNYIEFIDQSVSRVEGSNLKLSIVIPHFFDGAQAWTPNITFNGITTDTFTHLLKIMDRNAGGTILLMSYRNFFDGANGTKEISQVEIKDAQASKTKVIVGQETGNVDPSFITFYGMSKATLFSNVDKIKDAFKEYPSFGGVAVHYLDSFLDLK